MAILFGTNTSWLDLAVANCEECLVTEKFTDDDQLKKVRCIYPRMRYLVIDYT